MREKLSSKAFILKKKSKGEADQIISIYTEKFGKIDVLSKGIRKINSKLKGGLDDLSLLYVEFVETTRQKTLVDARIISDFSDIKKDTRRFKIISEVKETINAVIKGEEKDKELWTLLKEVFLKTKAVKDCRLFYHYFFWNMISILGYKIDIKNCFICGKKIVSEEISFLPKKGFIHFKCSNESNKIDSKVIDIIDAFLKHNFKKIKEIEINDRLIFSLNQLLNKASWFFS